MIPIHGGRGLKTAALAATAFLLAAGVAFADVVNGDFENGGVAWPFFAPADWTVSFPPAGGNPDGYALIQSSFGGPGGFACLEQTFSCGEPDEGTECFITLDYRLDMLDAGFDTGRIKVYIDGAEVLLVDTPSQDWATATFVVPCGAHFIQLCLEVDPMNNAWRACFDNVRAECMGGVSDETNDWSTIKSLYR